MFTGIGEIRREVWHLRCLVFGNVMCFDIIPGDQIRMRVEPPILWLNRTLR